MRAEIPLAAQLSAAGLDWIVPEWPAPGTVRALSTTRQGAGNDVADFARVQPAAGARALLRRFVPREPLWLAQTHGTTIVDADVSHRNAPEGDGAVSRAASHVCAILSADCLPVLFADRSGAAVAAAHAGWRGLAAGVLEATVASMQVAPANVLAWLGPAIGPNAFEVGPDVRTAFCDHDPGAGSCFVATREGKWHADLYALARRALARAGIDQASIYGGGRCTYSESSRFHSYRRGGVGRDARMATLIWLDPE
jgi:hypothetical protein